MKIGRPSRYTEMTLNQEKIGWQISMQGFAYAVWLAAFGDAQDLKLFIADVPRFMESREMTTLVFADQVPG